MSSPKRLSTTSIENAARPDSSEEIELQEVSQPLLPTDQEASPPIVSSDNEADETTAFPVNLDNDIDQTEVVFRPSIDDDSGIRRRRSSSRTRSPQRETGGIRRVVRNFWADLLPAGDRSAWRLPILLLGLFIVLLLVVIIIVVVGYTTVEYDEFAVAHNQLTGIMDLKNPYLPGVYLLLPWERLVTFDKTARYLNFDDLTIFTTDQASVTIDFTIVYRIRPDQIEPLWLNFASGHEAILRLVAQNILRNHGNQFSIYDYRARREHVEHRLSRAIQRELSGDCCPHCCQNRTCSKSIEWSCDLFAHCNQSILSCSSGYFVDIDAVYIFQVTLPAPIVKRLYTLMLKPIFTEIAESQENAAVVRIETEKQRNELLNKARQVLMAALADAELTRERARIDQENTLLKQRSTSERETFRRLNVRSVVDRMTAAFLLEFEHLANLTRELDMETFVTQIEENNAKTTQNNDLFDFVPPSNVFDLTEFLSLLDN